MVVRNSTQRWKNSDRVLQCRRVLRYLIAEVKTRMEINDLSLILKKVQLADKGLRLQCKILQKNKPLPLFYNVMVKNVSVTPTTGQSLFFPLRVWISPLHLIRCLYSLPITLLPITHLTDNEFFLFLLS